MGLIYQLCLRNWLQGGVILSERERERERGRECFLSFEMRWGWEQWVITLHRPCSWSIIMQMGTRKYMEDLHIHVCELIAHARAMGNFGPMLLPQP